MDDLAPVLPEEMVSRFVVESNKITSDRASLQYTAFKPNPNNGTTSVFRTDGLARAQVMQIGQTYVARPRGKNLYGWGMVQVAVITDAHAQDVPACLSVVPDIGVHPRHANILGWPVDKAQKKLLAIKLAEAATFVAV